MFHLPELNLRQDAGPASGLLVAAVLVGTLTTVLVGRLKGGDDDQRARRARTVRRVRIGVLSVVGLSIAYLGIELAPLPVRVESLLAGTIFVVAVWMVSRLLMQVTALLLETWLHAIPDGHRDLAQRQYGPLLSKVVSAAILAVALVVTARHFGLDLSSLIAALGVGSLAIGLAAQQTLGNMIAGFTLLADRPFIAGDRVKLATGEIGDVLTIGVRATRIRLLSGNVLIVPNTELVNSRVTNCAHPAEVVRAEVVFPLAYHADAERARQIIEQVVQAEPRVRRDPPAAVGVWRVGAGGVELSARFAVSAFAEQAPVEDQLLRRGLAALRSGGVDLFWAPGPRTQPAS